MRKILFILNPISGTKKKDSIIKYIEEDLSSVISFDIIRTEYKGHAKEIVKQNLLNNYDTIVAIGGDGTVNEVATHLIDQNISLGIIPTGSGNGLARSLGIPMNWKKSIDLILKNKIIKIDSLSINNLKFFNVAGTGFDSYIAKLFATNKKRGFLSYVSLTLKEFFSFKSRKSNIIIDGETKEIEYFLLSFANSPQFGNNAYISPLSSFTDGYLDLVVLRKFSFLATANIIFMLYTKRLHKSKHTTYFKCKSIILNDDEIIDFHIDGEPERINSPVRIDILPLSLTVITK